MRISRDLQRGARRLESVTPTTTTIEWIAPEGGWTTTNGVVTPMPATELAAELQGLRQEPYSIYHRLAHNDQSLRVDSREEDSTLIVYDRDERVLCWFQLDRRGGLVGWGNFYSGRFRFEYISARLNDALVTEPSRTPTRRQ